MFTPSILTIVGVIMYLRAGWVVGQAGLLGAIGVVLVAHFISLTTGLSIATLATNRTVGKGGAYFMISRSLGAPSGAAVGIPLFLSQALSVALYVVGFTEALAELLPGLPQRVVGTAVCAGLALLALKSTELALRVQYLIMTLIGLSLLSLFAGGTTEAPSDVRLIGGGNTSFGDVFAVFFPAVTGIMAGASMSGDLADPRRSLPKGTLSAIIVGLALYLAVPTWLAMNASQAELSTNKHVIWSVSRFPSLIYVGVWAATLSSALGSLMAAPRVLQALARDGLLPRFLGRGHGSRDEPRLGILATLAIALTGVLLGDLDAIAPVLTMFFLATYGSVNLACGLEIWAASPSFRPTFRVPFIVSLAGALACFYVMSIIHLPAMIAAVAVAGGLYAFTQRRALHTAYGDARFGIWAALVRTGLQHLRGAKFYPQNWRPNLIVFGASFERRPHLIELASTIVQDSGIVTCCYVLEGGVPERTRDQSRMLEQNELRIAEEYPNVFYSVLIAPEVYAGIVSTVQTYGIGGIRANTVMLGWLRRHRERRLAYRQMLVDSMALRRSLILVNYQDDRGFGVRRRIHVWWGGLRGNGGLMLLLAFLLTSHERWRGATVTLLIIVRRKAGEKQVEKNARRVLRAARIQADVRVVHAPSQSVADIMAKHSGDADLAIIGMRRPDLDEEVDTFFERHERFLGVLPSTLMVYSARDFSNEPMLLDEEQEAVR